MSFKLLSTRVVLVRPVGRECWSMTSSFRGASYGESIARGPVGGVARSPWTTVLVIDKGVPRPDSVGVEGTKDGVEGFSKFEKLC
jgi:hypothetical protein